MGKGFNKRKNERHNQTGNKTEFTALRLRARESSEVAVISCRGPEIPLFAKIVQDQETNGERKGIFPRI